MFVQFRSELFVKNFNKLTKKDTLLKKRLEALITEMVQSHPSDHCCLVGEYKGKWRTRLGDYRIVYAYCKECRANSFVRHNLCYDCGNRDDDALMLFDVVLRSKAYKK